MTSQGQSRLIGWLTARGRWHRLGLAILAGMVMSLGHAPFDLPWTFFVSLPLLVLMVHVAPTRAAAAWIGWGAGFGYFVVSLHWIAHPFLVDAARFAWLMPLGVFGLPAGLSLFWMLAFWAAKLVWRRGAITGAGILALAWALAEFARGNVLTGFPWAMPGYVWVDTAVMQTVAWIGPYGFNLLALWLCALPGVALVARPRWVAGAALAACVAVWIAGGARVPDTPQTTPDSPVVRLVQPNAPQHLKWRPEYAALYYQRALDLTGAPADPELGPPDIVIWPETTVTFVPAGQPAEVARISEAAGDAVVLLGAIHGERRATGDHWTNAFVSVLANGQLGPRYDKHHLVPFGEYLPFEQTLTALGLSQFGNRGGFARGPGPQTMRIPGVPAFSTLICYEAIFPHQIVGEDRPEWLVQPTNDAWFGSFAGPQQHYAQARIRAIEQGLPLVRAANTGISAVVDAYGREVVSISLHNYSFSDAKLPKAIHATTYSRHGELTFLLMVIFVTVVSIIFDIARPKH